MQKLQLDCLRLIVFIQSQLFWHDFFCLSVTTCMNSKICKKCKSIKEEEEFGKYRDKNNKQGRRNTCKECCNKYNTDRNLKIGRTKNPDRRKTKHQPVHDLTGQRFGNLSVIEFSGFKNYPAKSDRRAAYFRCKCDCGGEKEILGVSLKTGNTSSCGCGLGVKSREGSLLWTGYKGLSGSSWCRLERNAFKSVRSKRKDMPFDITKEYVWELYEKQSRKCALSGVDIILDVGSKTRNQTASLDRIDSSQGYIQGNVQWVHKDINSIKRDFEQDKFISLCKLVAKANP